MPWDKDNPPPVAKNWTPEEQRKCNEAAQAVLEREGWDSASAEKKKEIEQSAIYACIHNAGKSKQHAEVSNHYLEKFKQLVIGLNYFTQEQIDGIVKVARGYAGGKTKADNKLQAEIDGMTPSNVRGLATSDLLMAHRRLHNLYTDAEDGDKVILCNVHDYLKVEITNKRGLKHWNRDGLDGLEDISGKEKETKETRGSGTEKGQKEVGVSSA